MNQYTVVSQDGTMNNLNGQEDLRAFGSQNILGKNVASQYFVVDIDDTLRSSESRKELMPDFSDIVGYGDKPNLAWTKFNDACHLDTPLTSNINGVKGLISKYTDPVVIFLTSCTASELSAMVTKTQLLSYGFNLNLKNHHLIMRGADNQQTPLKMKLDFVEHSMLSKLFHPNVTIIDDNEEIIKEFSSQNYRTILV